MILNQDSYKEKHNKHIRKKELETKDKEQILKAVRKKDNTFKGTTVRLIAIFSVEIIKVKRQCDKRE